MSNRLRFGRFELLPTERQLLEEGRPVALGARAFDLLQALIERRGRLVGKAELLDVVWPGMVIEESNLPVQISALRRLIGPQAIATIPGRGYRFAVEVDHATASPPTPEGEEALQAPAPGPALGPALGNLPPTIDPLFGREADTQALSHQLASRRLVTVLGAGGIGKTRLAQAVAQARANAFAHGACWVDVVALTSTEKVVLGIAHAAGLPLGEGDALAQLVERLSRRELLLVLDNCEHQVTEIAAVAAAVLKGAPGVRILATSQELLRVSGEQVYPLDSLAVPPRGTPLAAARGYAALQLLEHRALAAHPRFQLSDDTVGLAIDLCRRLDGVALSIEMAAARLPMLGLRGLHERLGERLDLLHSPYRDAPTRHQTLRATLDWSHALLDADEQTVLRRLAVFAGSFRLEPAQRVAEMSGLDEWRVLDALTGLVDRSLVKLDQLDPPRYRLFDTVRLYAAERLAEAGETEAALDRHGDAMVQVADEAMQGDMPQATWLRRYGPDYEDLSATLDRARDRQDADAAAAVLGALCSLDRLRGVLTNSRRQVEAAYAMLPHASRLGQARLCSAIAYFTWIAVDHTSRAATARQAVALWRELGDEQELFCALTRVAFEAGRRGEYSEAESALREAKQIEQAAWPPRMRKVRAFNEGFVAGMQGDAARFSACMQEALALSLQAGSPIYAAYARAELARAALMAGKADEALAISRAAVEEYGDLDQPAFQGLALVTLCVCLLATKDLAGARAAAWRAWPLLEGSDIKPFLLTPLALLAALTGSCESAGLLLGFADTWRQAIENPPDWSDRLLAARAAAAIDAAIGATERSRLRDEGSSMPPSALSSLVHGLLAGSPSAG